MPSFHLKIHQETLLIQVVSTVGIKEAKAKVVSFF